MFLNQIFRHLFTSTRKYTTSAFRGNNFGILSLTTPKLIPIGMGVGIYFHRTDKKYMEGAICGGLTGWVAPILILTFGSAVVIDHRRELID